MGVLDFNRLTYVDLVKYLDPQGKVAPVVELLAQRGAKELFGYLGWQPGNLPTGHQFSVRTALPTAYLRDYNEGVAATKAAVAQMTEGMSIIEAWSEVDEAEADLNGEAAAFRAKENVAFIEAIEQKFHQLLIYGNQSSDNKEFNGFATRLAALASGNVIDCVGADITENLGYTSLYLAQFGDDFFGIYPKGSQAGWKHIDHGRQILQLSNNTRLAALVTQFVCNCGIVIRDWRRLVRIGNVAVSKLRTRTSSQAVTASTCILYQMANAIHMLPDAGGTRVFIANRTVIAALMNMALDKSAAVLSIESAISQFGRPYQQVQFMGIPVVTSDRILTTEARIF